MPATDKKDPLRAENPLDYVSLSREADVLDLVRAALDAERALLAFQPVMRADGTGGPVFYEGLLRLRDESGRIIPARHFMTEVATTALGRDLDAASLRIGLQALRLNPRLRLAINVSARSLGDWRWRGVIERNWRRSPELFDRLILEINEDSLTSLSEVVGRFWDEMQSCGMAFALDDFGAGKIAFRHLRDLMFDIVKIESDYVRSIDADPDGQAIVAALISVARQFDMVVVATGVETEAEAAILRDLGADCLQGFRIGVPKLTLD